MVTKSMRVSLPTQAVVSVQNCKFNSYFQPLFQSRRVSFHHFASL